MWLSRPEHTDCVPYFDADQALSKGYHSKQVPLANVLRYGYARPLDGGFI